MAEGQVRGGDGKYARTPKGAERDAEAARLRARGLSYRAIAKQMGWESPASALNAVRRCLKEIVEEPAEEVRKLELDRLDRMTERIEEVLDREHIVVSQGRIVRRRVTDENGDWVQVMSGGEPVFDAEGAPVWLEEDLADDSVLFAAVDRLLKIAERRAKLLGLDSPVKADIGGTLRYEIAGVDLGDPH